MNHVHPRLADGVNIQSRPRIMRAKRSIIKSKGMALEKKEHAGKARKQAVNGKKAHFSKKKCEKI